MITLLMVAIALMSGLLMTRLLGKWNMPDVTAYLIAGLLLGPFFIGRLGINGIGFTSYEQLESLGLINDVALGFIAFAIGNEFRIEQLRKVGKQATIVGIFQAVITTIVVDVALITFHFIKPDVLSLSAAITLGAIAAATAPAATLMVVRQYKANGPVTQILLPVVALDDAVGLVIFSFSFGIAKSLLGGNLRILDLIVQPVIEVVFSLLLGAVCGFILTELEKHFHSNRNRNALIVSFVILTVAIAKAAFHIGHFSAGFSSLLVCMMLGVVFCNTCPLSDELMARSDAWSAPVLTLFFVLSGAELQLEILANPTIILLGVIYIAARSLGKYYGAHISCNLAHCEKTVTKYLGITLFPQAGVALGMSSLAVSGLGTDQGTIVRNITLFGVLVYELIGPSLTKMALTKAGDIQSKSEEVLNRRERKLREAGR